MAMDFCYVSYVTDRYLDENYNLERAWESRANAVFDEIEWLKTASVDEFNEHFASILHDAQSIVDSADYYVLDSVNMDKIIDLVAEEIERYNVTTQPALWNVVCGVLEAKEII